VAPLPDAPVGGIAADTQARSVTLRVAQGLVTLPWALVALTP